MRITRLLLLTLCFLTIITISIAPDLAAQIRFKSPKIYVGTATGYDSNVFRVASSRDSNRIDSPVMELNSKLYSWIRWNSRIRTLIALKGNYDYFFSSSEAKEWKLEASLNSRADLIKPVKRQKWFRHITLDFDISYGLVDQIYTDRLLGEEAYISIGPAKAYQLAYGDLFDHSVFSINSGFDLAVHKQVFMYLGMIYDINDYKDLAVEQYNYLYALDNNDFGIIGKLEIIPVKMMKLIFTGEQSFCEYDFKTARNSQGVEQLAQNREYKYSQLELAAEGNLNPFIVEIAYSIKNRDDQFEGYYNYKSNRISGKLIYQINPKHDIFLSYSVSNKDYEQLTLGGKLLSNTYHYLRLGTDMDITKNLSVNPVFVYNDEESTYYKFDYSRNRFMVNVLYRIF